MSLISSFCSWSQIFAPDFLQIRSHPYTLAVGYALPTIGARSGLTPVRLCPCRANKKTAHLTVDGFSLPPTPSPHCAHADSGAEQPRLPYLWQ
ncbi:MAG: hypothetical protein HDR88_04725 [Bacteroides sp.]|nr:hypothetical protein [Bacteroides sp.]